MNRFRSASLIVVLAGLVCLGGAASLASATKVVELASYMSDPLPKAALEEQVRMFEAKYPEYKVNISTMAHEDFKTAIRVQLASKNPPDVFTWFAGNRANFFWSKDLIADITPLWQTAKLDASFPAAFKSICFFDGRAGFIPTSWYWWGVFYRKSIFQKYGLTEPKTWDEFLKVCETLKKNGVTPIAIGAKYRWTAAGWFDYLNLRLNGYQFHMDLMLGKAKYTDPRVLKVFKYWADLDSKGYFIKNPASYDWAEVLPYMARGEAAMYLLGQFILDNVPKEIAGDMDFFRFPIIDPSIPLAEDAPTDGFMVPKNAKNLDNGLKFLEFLASEPAQTAFVKATGRIVANTNVPLSTYPPLTQKGIKMIKESAGVAQFYDRDTIPPVADQGMTAMMEIWANPGRAQEILERLQKDVEKLFAEYQD